MNMKAKLGGVAVAIAALAAPAFAGPPMGNSGGRGKAGPSIGRSIRSGGDLGGISRGSSHSRGRSVDFGNIGRGGSRGGSNTPILDALRDAGGNNNARIGDGRLLREFARYADDYRERDYYRDREDDYRDSQRDAMIANAVVNVVGIIAATQAQKYAQPAPVYVAPAPAPAPVYVPAPAGHYETRRTMVQEGYHAAERVWVPEYRDASGAVVEGHYETHRRWVAPVYQETEVWVTH